MPKMAVDECPAGPAMDAAVAEALGWVRREWDGVYYWVDPGVDDFAPGYIASDYSSAGHKLEDLRAWSPSTDIAAAWELVNHLSQEWLKPGPKGGLRYFSCNIKMIFIAKVFLDGDEDRKHISVKFKQCPNGPVSKAVVKDNSFPLAICRAFLKANGVTEIEIRPT